MRGRNWVTQGGAGRTFCLTLRRSACPLFEIPLVTSAELVSRVKTSFRLQKRCNQNTLSHLIWGRMEQLGLYSLVSRFSSTQL